MTAKILNTEEYKKILQERFLSNQIEFKSASYAPLSENIEGFIGDHYILHITYTAGNKQSTESFFVKTKPTKTEVQKSLVNEMNVYPKEIFLYNYLFKEFDKYGYDTSFAPKSYFCKPYETIVMENLNIKDFKLFPRKDFYDLEHCKLSLKALALYHANSISYEEEKSRQLNKIFRVKDYKPEVFNEIFYKLDETDNFGTKFFKVTYDCFVKISNIMSESEEWKSSFKTRLLSIDLPKIFNKPLPYRKTCCHGDLWSNNMLFKYENSVPTHCCLVDYQLLRHHHPSFDVILILHSNTDRHFRQQYFQQLLDYYYDTFDDILKRNGFEACAILPKEHFLKAAEEFKIVSLIQGASTRLMTCLPPEILSDAVNSGGKQLEDMMFTTKRAEIALEACYKYEEFRKIMFDDVYDLDEII